MKKILSIKHIMGFIVFGMFLLFSSSAFAIIACKSPKVKCCPGGTKSCCEPRTDGLDYDLSCWVIDDPLISIDDTIIDGDDPFIGVCTVGKEQFKADGSCGFQTQTCCSDKTWSGWGKKCCNGEKPITFQTCTKTNGVQGTQTRTVSCDKTTGNWTEGDWGTCTGPDCTPGETSTEGCSRYGNSYTGYKYKEKTCGSNGYWESCRCPASSGNGQIYGKPYCQGTPRTAPANLKVDELDDSCYHGIWSDTTCTGICCCGGDTPYTDASGNPGCKDKRGHFTGACVCQTPYQIGEQGHGFGDDDPDNWGM